MELNIYHIVLGFALLLLWNYVEDYKRDHPEDKDS